MKRMAMVGLLAATLAVGAVTGASGAKAPVYILNGYSYGGITGVNTDELTAKLKDQAGARVTPADVAVDSAILTKELQARHLKGRLFTSLAEKHGRIWVIFDLQDPERPGGYSVKLSKRLKAQAFEGDFGVSADDLAAATGLKPGDLLTPGKIKAAHEAIEALYAKSTPGEAPSIKAKLQSGDDGAATLTWVISKK